MAETIPSAVLSVLGKAPEGEADPDAMNASFLDALNRRGRDPSAYRFYKGDETENAGITYSEAAKLIQAGVYGKTAECERDGSLSINEHSQHALLLFCEEVAAAWAKFQGRVKLIQSLPPLY